MQIAFLSNNTLNSVVVDAGTGQRLYNICTPYGVGKRKTTIHDAWGRTVAKYKRRWGRDQIELYGMTRSVSSWLPSDSLFTSSKRFVAPNGRTYIWKKLWGKSKFKLVDHHTKQVVARSRYTRSSLWSSKRISIEIDPQVVLVLDAIILSFIICEKDRRDQEEATVATSAVIV
ncbi:hypothetical protein VTO73DRAFT_5176 [Trametes versicolor]